jgi:Asp-tRNA(Asn)/Glu-tRNA(Gln) amidotransferase B subunit
MVHLNHSKLIVADGGKLLIEAYLSPNDPPSISVYNHPLLPKLSNRSEENEQIRQNVIDIISSTQLQKTVRGVHSVEKKYMGELMSRRKGKVDVNLAMTIIKEEMEKRLVFEPTTPGSKLLKVQHRSEVKMET